jgi:hypothetical protein
MNENMGVSLRRCSFKHTIDTVGNFSLHIFNRFLSRQFKKKKNVWRVTHDGDVEGDIA